MCTLDNIMSLMRKNKVSQKDLCSALGFTKQTFTNWKLGFSESYKKYLPQIADYFGVSVETLLGRPVEQPDLDETLKFALFNGDKEITDEMLDEVKRFAAFVKGQRKK